MHGQELGVVGSIGYCRTTWDFDISVHFDTLTLTGNPLTCSNRRFRVQTRVQLKKKAFTIYRVSRDAWLPTNSSLGISRLFDPVPSLQPVLIFYYISIVRVYFHDTTGPHASLLHDEDSRTKPNDFSRSPSSRHCTPK